MSDTTGRQEDQPVHVERRIGKTDRLLEMYRAIDESLSAVEAEPLDPPDVTTLRRRVVESMLPEPVISDVQSMIFAALAAEARERGVDLLYDRWAELDRVDPIVSFNSPIIAASGDGDKRSDLVQSHQITAVDGVYDKWGLIDKRPQTYAASMRSLGECSSRDDFADYLADLGDAQLVAYPGPLGPLFSTGADGRHRTHIIKALALPRFRVRSIRFPAVPRLAGDRGRVFLNTGFIPQPAVLHSKSAARDGAQLWDAADLAGQRARQDQRRRQQHWAAMVDHLNTLQRRGIIADLTVCDDSGFMSADFIVRDDLPAYWALELPQVVERLSRRYARSYPEFAATPVGRAMCDQTAWRHFLGIENGGNPADRSQGNRNEDPVTTAAVDTPSRPRRRRLLTRRFRGER